MIFVISLFLYTVYSPMQKNLRRGKPRMATVALNVEKTAEQAVPEKAQKYIGK